MFNLSELKEFNPALIYGFETENLGHSRTADELIDVGGQYRDILAAYLFSQNTILPAIEAHGFTNCGIERVLTWLKSIHKHMGNTLLKNVEQKAGQYTEEVLFRWEGHGAGLNTCFVLYFSQLNKPNMSAAEFAKSVSEEFNLKYQHVLDFTALLDIIARDNSICIPSDLQKARVYQDHLSVGKDTMLKLAVAYHNGRLSDQQQQIMTKLLRLPPLPSRVPYEMQKWAERLIKNYALCDKHNLAEVARFLAETFYELVEIHPFMNANKRTATCLLNILLRSMGYPSILLRYPSTQRPEDADFAKAFSAIHECRTALQELIIMRVQDAQTAFFADPLLQELIEKRVRLSTLIQSIEKLDPDFDFDRIGKQMQNRLKNEFRKFGKDSLVQTKLYLTKTIEKIEALIAQKTPNRAPEPLAMSPISQEQKQNILRCLSVLSGSKDWKMSIKANPQAWLECSSEPEADKIIKTLTKTGGAAVTLEHRKDNQKPVVMCRNICLPSLLEAVERMAEETHPSVKIGGNLR